MSESLFLRTIFKLQCNAQCNKNCAWTYISCWHIMYLYFEEGIGDGVSYIYKKYKKANNKFLNSYGPKQESRHIISLDANNLCDYAISKFLATSGFKWIDSQDWLK